MTSAPFRSIASRLRWGVPIVAAAVVASACSSANSVNVQHNKSGGGAGGYHYKIAMVTHGGAGDSFWSIVKAGGVQAGKDMGDDFTYQSNGDPTQQSQLIDAAVNQKPDGLIVSMANPEALKAAVQRAVSAGIPVVTINSGQTRPSRDRRLAPALSRLASRASFALSRKPATSLWSSVAQA